MPHARLFVALALCLLVACGGSSEEPVGSGSAGSDAPGGSDAPAASAPLTAEELEASWDRAFDSLRKLGVDVAMNRKELHVDLGIGGMPERTDAQLAEILHIVEQTKGQVDLTIWSKQLSDTSLARIGKLGGRVHELHLQLGTFSDAGLAKLGALTRAKTIRLTMLKGVTDAGVAALKAKLPETEVVSG